MNRQTLLTGRVRILFSLFQRASLLIFLLHFSVAGYVQAKDSPQHKQVSISLTNAPLESAFALIQVNALRHQQQYSKSVVLTAKRFCKMS